MTSRSGNLVDHGSALCFDLDYGKTDANGYSCSDYLSNSGADPYLCDGTNNGDSGFDAAAQCCYCGGGSTVSTTECSDLDGGLVNANGHSCADYTTDAGGTPGTFTCDTTNDGSSGFVAGDDCCFCGGGTAIGLTFQQPSWDWGFLTEVRQNFRITFEQATYSAETLTWDWTVTFNNKCALDEITSWSTEASDIDYTLLNTYASGQTVTSTASVPVWESSLDTFCSRSVDLQILQPDGTWLEIDKENTAYYDIGANCVDSASGRVPNCQFALDYPWMWWTAVEDKLKDGEIIVDTSKEDGSSQHFQDASTLAPYQNVGPTVYQLRWKHSSMHSIMGDGEGNFYDYFSVTITYECNTDVLELSTDLETQSYQLGSTSL